MTDQPYHHTPDHYTWLAQYTCRNSDEIPLVWGHDHDGAYRQLPLSDPSIAYVLLLTPAGPTLWRHHVLLFGSAASVWAYNRFGDMLSAIARTITCIPVVHYVDDYGSIEPSTTAQSGFDTFEQINSIPGFHMKKSKRQPPDHSHRIQGVLIGCNSDHITVSPCRDRIQNISQQLQTHVQNKSMTPEQARKLAGKCSFTTTHLFGRVGRAALRALYNKAFSNNDTMNSQTQSAIIALLDILNHCQPRQLPLRPHNTQHTIIYTDAFYRDGDKQLRCHDLLQQDERILPSPSMTNGWAAVVTCVQRNSTTQITETFRKQQSIHLLPRSLGSHHHTDPGETFTHTHLHTTIMRQRRSHSRHYQRLGQPCTLEQPTRVSLDLAQQTLPQTDPSPSPNTCQHCRSI